MVELFEAILVIASTTKSKKLSNDTLGLEKAITCFDVTQLTKEDYASCSIKFVSVAVQDGDTENSNIEDTKTVGLGELGTCTIRIANTTLCDRTLKSETAYGFVIEFVDMPTTNRMNSSGKYKETQYDYGWNKHNGVTKSNIM